MLSHAMPLPKRNDLHKFYFPPYCYSYNNYIASGVFSLAYISTEIDKSSIFYNKKVNGNCYLDVIAP